MVTYVIIEHCNNIRTAIRIPMLINTSIICNHCIAIILRFEIYVKAVIDQVHVVVLPMCLLDVG